MGVPATVMAPLGLVHLSGESHQRKISQVPNPVMHPPHRAHTARAPNPDAVKSTRSGRLNRTWRLRMSDGSRLSRAQRVRMSRSQKQS